MPVNALILFTDVRGFTSWSEAPEVFGRLEDFIAGFARIIADNFPPTDYLIKALGDGAMMVRELPATQSGEEIKATLSNTLDVIQRVNAAFAQHCQSFATIAGHDTPLRLGWGVVRGQVVKLDRDYVGHNMNKCARLCDLARPHGVVLDANDFKDVPPSSFKFSYQVRKLKGVAEDTPVWVTEEIATQFMTRESQRQIPEVHVAGLCIDPEYRGIRVLLAKRSERRTLYPGKYEGCGGQLAAEETFTAGVVRHFRMEMQIDVRVLEDLHCFYTISEPSHPIIPGIRFVCELTGGTPRSVNHSEVTWVTETELKRIPGDQFIAGVKDQWLELIERYKSLKPKKSRR